MARLACTEPPRAHTLTFDAYVLFTLETAEHALECARLEGMGKPAPFADGQIAAIAYVNELTLVTANVKDFARFKGVEVENWCRRRG